MAGRRRAPGAAILLLGLGVPKRGPETPEQGATLRQRLENLVAASGDAGFSGIVLVARGDSVLFEGATGLADRDRGVPLAADTPMEIMSITKLFSVLAVLMLHDDGRVDLDAPLASYLREFGERDGRPTVHDLLLHSAGLPARGQDLDRSSARAFVAAVAAATSPPPEPPQVVYSNPGYGLIPILVARVSGTPYRRFLRERVFEPAGMTATSFTGEVRNAAAGYRVDRGTIERFEPPEPMLGVLGATGVVTTPRDLFRWFRALQAGVLLSPRGVSLFTTEYVPGHGYSWVVDRGPGGQRRLHKDGLWFSFESRLAWYPERDVLIVVLSNLNRNAVSPLWTALEREVSARGMTPRSWPDDSVVGVRTPRAVSPSPSRTARAPRRRRGRAVR